MFGSRKNTGRRAPDDRYNRDKVEVTGRPADAPQPEPAGASTGTPVPKTEQKPAEKPLSQISLEYNGMGIVVLHEIDQGEQPQRIEQVIDRWKSVPKASRFDVLSFPRHIYCFDKQTGKIDASVKLPEKYAQIAQEEQDERVRAYMAQLTGEQPAAPAAGVLTAELINATSKDDLFDIAYGMKREDRQRVIDAFLGANKKRVKEAKGRQQGGDNGGSGESGGGQGGSTHEAQPAPRPQPQRQPAPQTTGGLSATRRRRGG